MVVPFDEMRKTGEGALFQAVSSHIPGNPLCNTVVCYLLVFVLFLNTQGHVAYSLDRSFPLKHKSKPFSAFNGQIQSCLLGKAFLDH